MKENKRVQRLLDEAKKELEKMKNNDKELKRLQSDSTKVYQFLEKKKNDVQKHYKHYEKQLEDKAKMIASLEGVNTMLSDRSTRCCVKVARIKLNAISINVARSSISPTACGTSPRWICKPSRLVYRVSSTRRWA